MVVAVSVDGAVELVEQIASVAREEINAANAALLQALVGVDRLTDHLGVTADQLAFLCFCTSGLRVKFFELMLHFRTGGFSRIDQGFVELF